MCTHTIPEGEYDVMNFAAIKKFTIVFPCRGLYAFMFMAVLNNGQFIPIVTVISLSVVAFPYVFPIGNLYIML
jgi:hypothetical protein